MLEQYARVVQSSEQGVWVKPSEPQGCGVCAGQGCASRRIAELFQRVPRQYQVESHVALSAGDHVIVGLPEGSVLRSALILYGMPLILMLAGALLAQLWFAGDVGAVVGAVAGLLLSGIFIARASLKHLTSMLPMVIRRGEASNGSILEEEK